MFSLQDAKQNNRTEEELRPWNESLIRLISAAFKIGWAACGCDGGVSACCFFALAVSAHEEARFSPVRIAATFVRHEITSRVKLDLKPVGAFQFTR